MYLTRNQADGNVSGVRIPPSPPEKILVNQGLKRPAKCGPFHFPGQFPKPISETQVLPGRVGLLADAPVDHARGGLFGVAEQLRCGLDILDVADHAQSERSKR